MRRITFLTTLVVLATASARADEPPASKAAHKTVAPAPPKAAAPKRPEAKPANPAPEGPEFPNNEAGRHAAAWFHAFNAGEAAMRKYLQAHVAPAALEKRTLEDRMEIYHNMKEERGALTPLEVQEFTDSSVKAIARGERGGRFAITFRCEEEAPHALLGLQVEDLPPEEGTPEGADDAEFSQGPAPPSAPARRAMRVTRLATTLRA